MIAWSEYGWPEGYPRLSEEGLLSLMLAADADKDDEFFIGPAWQQILELLCRSGELTISDIVNKSLIPRGTVEAALHGMKRRDMVTQDKESIQGIGIWASK